MADLYTRVLVDVSYAAGSAGYSGSGDEVLTLLQQGTHHEAAALLAWDRLQMRHRPIVSAGYRADTVEQLGDRYVVSAENRALETASGPVRIDDLPQYRETPMFREVLAPAGFQDGMTSRLYRDDGSYAGMLHVSAADVGTFDHRARDLVAALGTVMSRLIVVKRPPALLPPAPEGALVGVVDHFGGVKPVDGFHLPLAMADHSFQAVVARFLRSSSPAAVGLWPTGRHWASVMLTRVVDQGLHAATLVQETQIEPIPYGLSNRELDILAGMASGHTNRQIAAFRSISVRTVTSHVESILRKMDTGSRATAVVAAAREGLLRLDCAQTMI
ncbi:helix-turn-helix transcriptional regulator [Antrihabitans sp. YC3-6]|uniref:Helix-turn-helix transcriptional regulator n=1 Tax=Antrihabitans stalagmiti TaxID=2799499 RepID=A0A934NQA5_9NOCA|nr:helix-turn-helix transcriptional regulator [Antrihabitans stalagmiti]MBJ8339448.1 helix-turn-helix transcriptional regulator [Antrihabitans stalagmiti]